MADPRCPPSAPAPPPPDTLRRQILERMKAALGEPEVSRVESGELYRWTLRRAFDLNVYVTLDSPERNDIAHIMVSDSTAYQDGPIVSTVVRSLAEAEAVIRNIVEQWKRPRKKPPSP